MNNVCLIIVSSVNHAWGHKSNRNLAPHSSLGSIELLVGYKNGVESGRPYE